MPIWVIDAVDIPIDYLIEADRYFVSKMFDEIVTLRGASSDVPINQLLGLEVEEQTPEQILANTRASIG